MALPFHYARTKQNNKQKQKKEQTTSRLLLPLQPPSAPGERAFNNLELHLSWLPFANGSLFVTKLLLGIADWPFAAFHATHWKLPPTPCTACHRVHSDVLPGLVMCTSHPLHAAYLVAWDDLAPSVTLWADIPTSSKSQAGVSSPSPFGVQHSQPQNSKRKYSPSYWLQWAPFRA